MIQTKDKNKTKAQMKKTKKRKRYSDTEDEDEPVLLESGDSSAEEDDINNCVGCGENYYQTKLIEDWIQCIVCKRWVHENCTEFDDKCHPCGNIIKEKGKK